MVRLSKERSSRIDEIGAAIVRMQDATDEVDEAAAERFGLNRSDLRCLGHCVFRGPLPAGELARATGLTPGALTTLLDRLERAGFARRVRDAADRRRVLVQLTPKAQRLTAEIWGPIADEGREYLRRYSHRELEVILDFIRHGTELQLRHAARIREKLRRRRRSPRSPTASA